MSLEILLKNRETEFAEIADAIGMDIDTPSWKQAILDFSLQFHDCLTAWEKSNSGEDEIHRCYNVMAKISRKNGVSKMLQTLYIINKIAEDYKMLERK